MKNKVIEFLNNDKVFLIAVGIGLLLIVAIFTSNIVVGNYLAQANIKKSSVYNKYFSMQTKMKNKNEEALAKILSSSFKKSQLVNIVQKFSTYTLIINDEKITKEKETIISETPKIKISLFENYGNDTLENIPKKIIEMASVLKKNRIGTLVRITTTKAKAKKKIVNIDNGKLFSCNFRNVKPGEIITMEIEPKLAEKIGLENTVIEIFYSKVKK